MSKFIIYNKDLRGKPHDSKFIKNLTASNADAKRVLKNRTHLDDFVKKVKEAATDGGVTRGEMRRIIGEEITNKSDSINASQAKTLGGAIIKSGRRYILPARSISASAQKQLPTQKPITSRLNEIMAGRKNMPVGPTNASSNSNRPNSGIRPGLNNPGGMRTGHADQ